MNFVILQGRPAFEPTINKSEKGLLYSRNRLCVEGPYRGDKSPRKTYYFTIVFFGKQAQTFYNNVAKGALITIGGRLDNDPWTDEMGKRRDSITVIAEKLSIHEWLKKGRPISDMKVGFDDDADLLIPREITNSLFKQVDIADEDIPDDLLGDNVDDLV